MSAHDDAVHHVPAQHIDVLDFAVRLVGGGAQHGAQPLRGERMLQVRGKRCKERVTDGGHDDADQVGAVVVQISGELVRYIIEQLHGFAHAVAHVGGHVSVAVYHQRDGTQGHPGLLRHIAHTDHDRTLLIVRHFRTLLQAVCRSPHSARRLHARYEILQSFYILSNLFDSPVCISFDGVTPHIFFHHIFSAYFPRWDHYIGLHMIVTTRFLSM